VAARWAAFAAVGVQHQCLLVISEALAGEEVAVGVFQIKKMCMKNEAEKTIVCCMKKICELPKL